jgi:hypothetical protein
VAQVFCSCKLRPLSILYASVSKAVAFTPFAMRSRLLSVCSCLENPQHESTA